MESRLAVTVREARIALGLTQAEAAARAGITPSYLSRIESAAWEHGGPWPSNNVLRALARVLTLSSTDLIAEKDAARSSGIGGRRSGWAGGNGRAPYSVSVGDEAVYEAAGRVLDRLPRGGSLRMANVFALAGPRSAHEHRHVRLLESLARRLADDPDAMLSRVVTATPGNLGIVRCSAEELGGGREPEMVGNVRCRFTFGNPLVLDVVIAEHEAVIALPDRRGQPYFRAAVVIDDPDFVSALRGWFDEFVWESSCDHAELPYGRLEESLEEIRARLQPAG